MSKDEAISFILKELNRSRDIFGDFKSPHEGYAILKEEVDELWEDIKANRGTTEESIQVAAMALKFLLCFGKREDAIDSDFKRKKT